MSNFRITQRGLGMNVLRHLQGNLGEMQKLQEQMSSGRSISKPSDSPTGTVSALRLPAMAVMLAPTSGSVAPVPSEVARSTS